MTLSKKANRLRNARDKIDRALDKGFHQGMYHNSAYTTLMKEKAILEMEEDDDKATAYFLESAGVNARQFYISTMNKSKFPQSKLPTEIGVLREDLVSFKCDPLAYEERLAALPSEWTVLQISELHPGQRLFPPAVLASPLRLARFGCGQLARQRSIRIVDKPHSLPAAREADLLKEFKSCVEEFTGIFRTPRVVGYQNTMLKCEARFQVVLEGIRDWLGPWRCLMLGNIADKKKHQLISQRIGALAEELKIDEKFLVEFSLLTQCANVFSKVDLVEALKKISPSAEVDFIKTAMKKMKSVASEVIGAGLEELNSLDRHPVILIVDKTIFGVPWEQIDVIVQQPVSRMHSLPLIHALHTLHGSNRPLDPLSTYFVVDPDKNLPATAKRLKPVLLARDEWTGVIGTPPAKTQLAQQLQDTDIYLYSGHGSGAHLMPDQDIIPCKSTAMLLGCSSADINRYGVHWDMTGLPTKMLLSGSPIVLGMLWMVLDRDTDRMTVRLLESWLPPKVNSSGYKLELCKDDRSFAKVFENVQKQKGILKALRIAQTAATSKIMSSAFIACGIPVSVTSSC